MLQHLDQIHPQVQEWIEPLFDQTIEVFSASIDSIYLYGEVVTADYVPKRSKIESLILFDAFHFERAKQLQPIVKKRLKYGVTAPLCLAVETLEGSTDTFPLEWIEIKEKHIQVYGETNRVSGLEIPLENLRLKIEEQIKGKLIRLREVYIESGNRPGILLDILSEALPDLMPVLRNLLRFFEVEDPPKRASEVLKTLGEKTESSVTALQSVLDHIQRNKTISKADAIEVYGGMADVLLDLSKRIDRMQKSS